MDHLPRRADVSERRAGRAAVSAELPAAAQIPKGRGSDPEDELQERSPLLLWQRNSAPDYAFTVAALEERLGHTGRSSELVTAQRGSPSGYTLGRRRPRQRGGVHGWSWSPAKAILTLRNRTTKRCGQGVDCRGSAAPISGNQSLEAGQPRQFTGRRTKHIFTLGPFEVLTLAAPRRKLGDIIEMSGVPNGDKFRYTQHTKQVLQTSEVFSLGVIGVRFLSSFMLFACVSGRFAQPDTLRGNFHREGFEFRQAAPWRTIQHAADTTSMPAAPSMYVAESTKNW